MTEEVAPIPVNLGQPDPAHVVGRERELAEIRSHLQAGSSVLLTGERRIGKSWVVRALQASPRWLDPGLRRLREWLWDSGLEKVGNVPLPMVKYEPYEDFQRLVRSPRSGQILAGSIAFHPEPVDVLGTARPRERILIRRSNGEVLWPDGRAKGPTPPRAAHGTSAKTALARTGAGAGADVLYIDTGRRLYVAAEDGTWAMFDIYQSAARLLGTATSPPVPTPWPSTHPPPRLRPPRRPQRPPRPRNPRPDLAGKLRRQPADRPLSSLLDLPPAELQLRAHPSHAS